MKTSVMVPVPVAVAVAVAEPDHERHFTDGLPAARSRRWGDTTYKRRNPDL